MTGRWAEFGCDVYDTNTTHTVCKCQHLTNFAVLMNVRGTQVRRDTHRSWLFHPKRGKGDDAIFSFF